MNRSCWRFLWCSLHNHISVLNGFTCTYCSFVVQMDVVVMVAILGIVVTVVVRMDVVLIQITVVEGK